MPVRRRLRGRVAIGTHAKGLRKVLNARGEAPTLADSSHKAETGLHRPDNLLILEGAIRVTDLHGANVIERAQVNPTAVCLRTAVVAKYILPGGF